MVLWTWERMLVKTYKEIDMAEPPGRVTPLTDFDLWKSLYAQWEAERYPSTIVRGAGANTWSVVQHTSGSYVFDPVDHQAWYDSTSFPG